MRSYSEETLERATQKVAYHHPKPSNTLALHVNDYLLDGNKAAWRQVEEWMCERHGWDDVDASTHDALSKHGEKIEIKSCVWRCLDGQPGRITLWPPQFREADYLAAVVIVDMDDSVSILSQTIIHMANVRPNIAHQHHTTMGYTMYHTYDWTELVTPDDVRDDVQHELVNKCQLSTTPNHRYNW
jgi:hypothetical protein